MRVIGLLALLGSTLVSPASAAQPGPISPPFSKLFKPPAAPSLTAPAPTVRSTEENLLAKLRSSRQQPKVVCGMTMVPVDSSLDPKIVRPVPPGKFTIKAIKPPICGQ